MHKSKECVVVGFAGEEKSNHPKTLVKQWVHTQVKVFGQKSQEKVMHSDQSCSTLHLLLNAVQKEVIL